MMENESYKNVIGNTQDMPYLNGLATTYAYAAQYYANRHPSLPNYFKITTGHVITKNDGYTSTVTIDNIVRHLDSAGKTWKEYSESLPFVGYGGGDTGDYTEHHNPMSYFSDVRESQSEMNNLVPFTQFALDLANHDLPDYTFIVPNNQHDAHSCEAALPNCTGALRRAVADNWLKTNIDPLIQSPDFNTPGGGLLIIVFDESNKDDTTMGGGHVAWVVVGPDVKKAYVSTTTYQHDSTLRFMSQVIGLTTFPGTAACAPDMWEFLVGN